ncbi:hypothetical protein TYRP_011667 [Tyrophagus putrescentiae]|nr:hypothetical protein TYRP_011667 [Tyrophagus putrescentiae]
MCCQKPPNAGGRGRVRSGEARVKPAGQVSQVSSSRYKAARSCFTDYPRTSPKRGSRERRGEVEAAGVFDVLIYWKEM